MDNFLHTVDMKATPAVWRASLAKSFADENAQTNPEDSTSVSDMIEERHRELARMSAKNARNLEDDMGETVYARVERLAELSKEEFEKQRRVNWKAIDYMRYAYRMIMFMIRGFSARRLYVEGVADMGNLSSPINESPKYQSNWEFLAYLSCQPQYRTKEMLAKIFYFVKSLNIMRLFPANMHEEVCRHIIYTKLDHGRIVVQQGKRPEKFYFIFEGKMNLIREIELSNKKLVVKSVGWINRHEHLNVDDIEQQRVSPDQMVTVGQTQLLYIDVDEFLRLRKVEDKIPRIYLQSLPLFKMYPLEKLLQQAGAVECSFYESGKLICSNLKASPNFFISKNGHCAILRRQKVTDVKKTKEYQKASHPDLVGAKKPFLHAFETTDNKLTTREPVNSVQKKLNKLAVNGRTSTPIDTKAELTKGKQWNLLENYVENRDSVVTKKVFVQIGVLTEGNIAGMHEQNLTTKEGVTNTLSLVSQGAEVVKIHKQRFFVLAVSHTLAQVQTLFRTYRPETEVQQEIDDKETWPYYKKNYVSKFLEEKKRNKALLEPRGT